MERRLPTMKANTLRRLAAGTALVPLLCAKAAFAQPPAREAPLVAMLETPSTTPALVTATEDALLCDIIRVPWEETEANTLAAAVQQNATLVIAVSPNLVRLFHDGEILSTQFAGGAPPSMIASLITSLVDDFDIPLPPPTTAPTPPAEASAATASEAAPQESTAAGDVPADSDGSREQNAGPETARETSEAARETTEVGADSGPSERRESGELDDPPFLPVRDGLWLGGELQIGIGVGAQAYLGSWLTESLRFGGVVAVIVPFSTTPLPFLGAELAWVTGSDVRFELGPALLFGLSGDEDNSKNVQFNMLAGALVGVGFHLSRDVVLVLRLRMSFFYEYNLSTNNDFLGGHGALTGGIEWSL